MAELGNPLASPFPLAVYSVPLKLASAAKYWDPTVIPEDWHMYFRFVSTRRYILNSASNQ